jgi:hypothetical protein
MSPLPQVLASQVEKVLIHGFPATIGAAFEKLITLVLLTGTARFSSCTGLHHYSDRQWLLPCQAVFPAGMFLPRKQFSIQYRRHLRHRIPCPGLSLFAPTIGCLSLLVTQTRLYPFSRSTSKNVCQMQTVRDPFSVNPRFQTNTAWN